MPKEVSIQHVAQRAGVSLSTVSLVVNEKPNVSVKTARRVREAIQELGYNFKRQSGSDSLPNGRVRRTNRIALCMLKKQRSLLSSSVYADVLAGIEEALRKQNLTLILIGITDPSRFLNIASKYSFDGMILLGVGSISESIIKAAWQYPCVKVMGTHEVEGQWFDQVLVNNAAVSRLAGQYLLDQGHRHCAYLGRHSGSFEERSRVFQDFLVNQGRDVSMFVDDQLVEVTADAHIIHHQRLGGLVDQLLALSDRPTGLMVDSDTIVTAVYQHLLARGIRPGIDMDVVSCNNERSVIANLNPRPAVIDTQAHDMGVKAAEQLIWRIANRQAPKTISLLEPRLVVAD